MPLLCFKERFAAMVESGVKTCTIRAHRKRPIKVGDWLSLRTGCRTAQCRKLNEGICLETWPIKLCVSGAYAYLDNARGWWGISRGWVAREDGFADYAEMMTWFETVHGLPIETGSFEGDFIRWKLLPEYLKSAWRKT